MPEYESDPPHCKATFSSDINSGSLRLLGYPASTNSTTFKTMFTAIDV